MSTIQVTFPTDWEAPQRGEPSDVFSNKANIAWSRFRNVMVPNLNVFGVQANALSADVSMRAATATAQAASAAQSATLALTYRADTLGHLTGTQRAYQDTLALLNTLVIPTEATYTREAIDSKIAEGVLTYGMAYGFGGVTTEGISEKEAFSQRVTDTFALNYLLGA